MNTRLALWLAIAGMALNALWPLIANAHPKVIPLAVCSMSGMKTIEIAVEGSVVPSGPDRHERLPDCCSFCASGTCSAPLAPSAVAFVSNPDVVASQFLPADASDGRSVAFLPAHSRAPPVLS